MKHRLYPSLSRHQFAVLSRIHYKNILLGHSPEPYGTLVHAGRELGLTDDEITQIRNCEHSFVKRVGVPTLDQWEHLLNKPRLKKVA